VTPSNTPSNCLDGLRTPIRTPIRTGIRSCSNTPANTLRTYPPHPPGGSKRLARAFHPPANTAALALRSCSQALDKPDCQITAEQPVRSPVRLSRERGCNRGWLERPHHPIMRVDIQRRAVPTIGAMTPHSLAARQRTRQGLCQLSLNSREGTPLLHTRSQTRLETLSFARERNRQAAKATVKSHGEGIYARGVPHSKSLLGSNGAHARALFCRRRNGSTGETQRGINQTAPKVGRVGWGVAVDIYASVMIDLIAVARGPVFLFRRGPCSKKLAALSEKVGLPVKGPALTHGAAQDASNGPVRRLGSARGQNSPAGVSDSRRGMLT
jgi:hypothetical protein